MRGEPMASILEHVDLRDAGAVIAMLRAGTAACIATPGRRGCTEWVEVDPSWSGSPGATLIATGDLHDNPLHLARLVRAAGIDEAWEAKTGARLGEPGYPGELGYPREPGYPGPCHLTLHELIHGDRLVNGLDYSYRVLVRAAAMKAAFPDRVHVLLANHEIAQLSGTAVAKDGVRCNEAFDEAIDVAFGDRSGEVRSFIHVFLTSLPLAVRFRCAGLDGDVLCAHSLPAPEMMGSFDLGALDRELTPEDFTKRTGAARAMTWGRGHTAEQIAELARRWNVRLFALGHEKAEEGATVLSPQAIVLNSDHERGVYARMDLTRAATVREVAEGCVRLSEG
jgi:hypothetical protein